MLRLFRTALALSLPASLLAAPAAFAQQSAASAHISGDEVVATPELPPGAPAPFSADAIADTALAGIAGREDTNQQSTANQNATVTRNSVGDNARTGDASISGSAFQNLQGLSILNVNTGNNVAINAAMNVNIAINPGQ